MKRIRTVLQKKKENKPRGLFLLKCSFKHQEEGNMVLLVLWTSHGAIKTRGAEV